MDSVDSTQEGHPVIYASLSILVQAGSVKGLGLTRSAPVAAHRTSDPSRACCNASGVTFVAGRGPIVNRGDARSSRPLDYAQIGNAIT